MQRNFIRRRSATGMRHSESGSYPRLRPGDFSGRNPNMQQAINPAAAWPFPTAGAYVTVPQTTLPGGLVVPEFWAGQFLAGRGADGKPVSRADVAPWVEINYHESIAAANDAGLAILRETQALAIAWNASQQDENWSGGKVGEGVLFMGLHKGTVDEAQPASYESPDADERRWLVLSNGERIYDFGGNAFFWVFDDIQGDDQGLTTLINADSPSLTTAPYPSMEKGMAWRPDGQRDWSGLALIRGGYWFSESCAGAFSLSGVWPVIRSDFVGFRCTQPGL